MATLYLMRHGQSEANVERVFSNGRVDLPLTALGREQARRAAEWLYDKQIRHVVSAPLLRARQTADLLARRLGVDVTVLADLDEVRVGDLDGRRGGRYPRRHPAHRPTPTLPSPRRPIPKRRVGMGTGRRRHHDAGSDTQRHRLLRLGFHRAPLNRAS